MAKRSHVHVLVIGECFREYQRHAFEKLYGLTDSLHPDFRVETHGILESLKFSGTVKPWMYLDLVFFVRNEADTRNDLLRDAKVIADQCDKDPRRPWVSCESDLQFLVPIFLSTNMYVQPGFVASVMYERWRSRRTQRS